jgi:heptosyltransferase-2
VVDLNLSLIEQLGIACPDRRQLLVVTEEQRNTAWERLRRLGLDPAAPRIGLHVREGTGAGDGAWSPSHHASILQRAALEMGYQPLLLAEEHDRSAVEQVLSLGRSEVPALVGLPLTEYKAVVSCLTFFVCDDGGPVHLAAAVGVPSFFLFLSTPAWRWAPYGPHVNVWDESERPGHPPTPLEVWERVKPLLAEAEMEDREAG